MQYFISFLEGIVTFISPCLLPMLPVYVSYFTGGIGQRSGKALTNSLAFVLGFTTMFVAMGALAGTLGGLLREYNTIVNVISGIIVVIFGLNYLGVFHLNIFKGIGAKTVSNSMGIVSSFVFGVIFSIGWTPCVGAFLGSALMLASGQGTALEGVLMLLAYSMGLGIPFVVCAVFIDKLKDALNLIKRNYRTINLVCGIFLVLVGVMMMLGIMDSILRGISVGINL